MSLPRLLPARRAKRLASSVCALAVAIGALGLLADPASAEMKCTGRTDANVCLTITSNNNQSTYFIHIGIDVHMSLSEAQAYVRQGRPFTVRMMGSDTFSDDVLFEVPMSAIGASAESGLGADFDVAVGQFAMDEDDSFFDDIDEVYANIDLFNSRNGRTFNYRSHKFTQVF